MGDSVQAGREASDEGGFGETAKAQKAFSEPMGKHPSLLCMKKFQSMEKARALKRERVPYLFLFCAVAGAGVAIYIWYHEIEVEGI